MRIHKTTVSTYLEAVSDFADRRNKLLSMENQLITGIMNFAKEYFEYRKNDPEFLKEMRMYNYTALNEVEFKGAVKDLALLDKIITNYTLELGKITADNIFMRVVERDYKSNSWWVWSFPTEFLTEPNWKQILSGELVEPVSEPEAEAVEPSEIESELVTKPNIEELLEDDWQSEITIEEDSSVDTSKNPSVFVHELKIVGE